MGQIFASIHIKTPDTESVEDAIFQSYARKSDRAEMIIQMMKAAHPEFTPEEIEHTRQLYALHDHNGEMIFCVKTEQYLSVCDGNLSFETVEEKARQISEKIQVPVVYTSNFDDDLFLFGVMESGHVITHGCIGEDLEECYGVKSCAADLRLFSEALGLSGEIPELPEDDVEEGQAIVEKMLGIELNLRMPLPRTYRLQRMMQGIPLFAEETET